VLCDASIYLREYGDDMLDGNRLREARQAAKLSQQRLGEMIGQDQQYVSKLERGVLPGMTVETLERLCSVLSVSADYLLGLGDEAEDTELLTAAVA
jgi:transcriptional regulator with XRE-family HTH domain